MNTNDVEKLKIHLTVLQLIVISLLQDHFTTDTEIEDRKELIRLAIDGMTQYTPVQKTFALDSVEILFNGVYQTKP